MFASTTLIFILAWFSVSINFKIHTNIHLPLHATFHLTRQRYTLFALDFIYNDLKLTTSAHVDLIAKRGLICDLIVSLHVEPPYYSFFKKFNSTKT